MEEYGSGVRLSVTAPFRAAACLTLPDWAADPVVMAFALRGVAVEMPYSPTLITPDLPPKQARPGLIARHVNVGYPTKRRPTRRKPALAWIEADDRGVWVHPPADEDGVAAPPALIRALGAEWTHERIAIVVRELLMGRARADLAPVRA
jgi:hypothetical protein